LPTGIGTLEPELPHVGEVEEPGRAADRLVLLDEPLILHRHFPAGEGDQLGAEGAVTVNQSGLMHDEVRVWVRTAR
jgi:hypothetical protein